MRYTFRKTSPHHLILGAALVAGCAICGVAIASCGGNASGSTAIDPSAAIQHVVVIIQENETFDHYFGVFPNALNAAGEPAFTPVTTAPAINGLSASLLNANPTTLKPQNGAGAINPFRLTRMQALVADENHDYGAEQRAFDRGAMDLSPLWTGNQAPGVPGLPPAGGTVMGYYDGNTITAMWNYASRFAMSDNSFGTTFGPSVVGYLNIISGQTNGAVGTTADNSTLIADGAGGCTVIGSAMPLNEVCSGSPELGIQMSGRNIGDLLNAANISWGYFLGGFDLTAVNSNGSTGCLRNSNSAIAQSDVSDYLVGLQPFQFYASTANPTHIRPQAGANGIGHSGDGANHEYDTDDFLTALQAGNLPAVSFLCVRAINDGHPGFSDALDEQAWVVQVVNAVQRMPQWNSTAVIIMWDDSGGWYDHVKGPTVNGSATELDFLDGNGICGSGVPSLPGVAGQPAAGRCGYGPRVPLLVISPWARQGYVDHTLTDQTSVIHLIEDLFLKGQRIGGGSYDSIAGSLEGMFDFSQPNPQNAAPLLLDTVTGEPNAASQLAATGRMPRPRAPRNRP